MDKQQLIQEIKDLTDKEYNFVSLKTNRYKVMENYGTAHLDLSDFNLCACGNQINNDEDDVCEVCR